MRTKATRPVGFHVLNSTSDWSQSVGLRTRPVSDQKSVLVLVLQVWCRVVKHGLITLVVIMILKDIAAFQVLLLILCDWNITTVEFNSGVHLLKS